jgi:hypothetical protein
MKKIGFLKTTKSKIMVGIIVMIIMCMADIAFCFGLPALLFVYAETPRSGDQLFKDFILDPMPKSVKVLDSYDGGPDLRPDNCLHFKISPADFQLVLTSRKWEFVSEDPNRAECRPWPSPPPSLGRNVIIYSYVPGKNNIEVMFTNSQMNEVYYYFSDGNLP